MSRVVLPLLLALALAGCPPPAVDAPDALEIRVDLVRTLGVEDPMAGVDLIVDLATGERRILTTDRAGVATLELDWRIAGPVTVTADPGDDSLAYQTRLDLTEDESPFRFQYFQLGYADDTATVSGTVSPRTEDSYLDVVAHAPGGTGYQESTDTYEVEVPTDTPFVLVAWEFTASWSDGGLTQPLFNWTRVAHDGIGQDTIVDIDLSESIEPEVGGGSATVSDELIGAYSGHYAVVYSESSNYQRVSGAPTEIRLGDDGFEYELAWVRPHDGEKLVTAVWANVRAADFSEMSIAFRDGTPDEWADDHTELLPVPSLLPSDDGSYRLRDTHRFVEVPEGATASLEIMDDFGDASFWTVVAPAGVRELTVPIPPPGMDQTRLQGAALGLALTADPGGDDDIGYYVSAGHGFRL